MQQSIKNRLLNLGIKAKLSLLTTLMIFITLVITLAISSTREIQFKKAEAKKLMINLGKQIALMKGLEQSPPKETISEYLEKTVHSSFSRRGYSIAIVYIISTNLNGELELGTFNWNIIQAPQQDAELLAKKILEDQLHLGERVQEVKIEMGPKGNLHVGFSMQILKNEILAGILDHVMIGLLLITLGILGAIGVAKKITQPFFKLIEGFQKVAKGDFQTQVQIKTHDELEQLAQSFNQMTLGLRERELIKDIFRRYATDQVVEKILKGEVRPTLSGELREVTVLFSDIRMFTPMAAKLHPEQVVYILNRYFTAMTDVVIENEGLIDKFTGDEMMIVFGAPIQHPDDPQRAIRTAMKMLQELRIVNEHLEKEGYPKIDIGIGINTGVAVAGNIGSEKRMAYTVIGQDVNLASRLVAIAQKGEIVLSTSTYEKVRELVQASEETLSVKGLDEPLNIYRVKG